MFKEEKICSLTAPKRRIQLLKITEEYEIPTSNIIYQIRINRKIIDNTINESIARSKFASIVTSEVLQQKFNF